MWRVRPIVKLAALVILACVVIKIGSGMLAYVRVLGISSLAKFGERVLAVGAQEGLLAGLYLAIPMVLVTVIFFREISKPTFYRWTMLTVALLATIAQWGWLLERAPTLLSGADDHMAFAVAQIAVVLVLQLIACHIAAGVYLRAVLSRTAHEAEELAA